MKMPSGFLLRKHWVEPIDGVSSEPDMSDSMSGYIKRLHEVPYEMRTFTFLTSVQILKQARGDLPAGKCVALSYYSFLVVSKLYGISNLVVVVPVYKSL